MAIISFNEIHNGRDGDEDLTVATGKTVRRYTRVFRATTNDNYDDADDVLNYPDCPIIGDQFPTDSAAYCQRRKASNESFSKRVWIVTIGYSSEREITDDPLAEPAEIDWTTEQFQRPYWKDRNGNGCVNSAGDPFDPPIEGDDSRWIATVSKNVAAVPTWLLTYRDAVNSNVFTLDGLSIVAGAAKIQQITISRRQQRNNISYRTITIGIAVDSAGWAKSELDRGFRELDGTTGNRKTIRNVSDGDPVTDPALLDGSGSALDPPSAGSAVFIDFDIYPSKDFSVLPLS